MKIKILLFAALGCMSGFLSDYFFQDLDLLSFYFLPGVTFGITISFLLYFFYRKSIYFHLIYIILSTAAYFLAVLSVFLFDERSEFSIPFAGVVGSFILFFGLRIKYFIPIRFMFAMGLIGMLATFSPGDIGNIFIVWQTMLAITIIYAIEKSKNISNKNSYFS